MITEKEDLKREIIKIVEKVEDLRVIKIIYQFVKIYK